MFPIRPNADSRRAAGRARRRSRLLCAMLTAAAPVLGASDGRAQDSEAAIIAGEVARLQQLDADLKDLPQLEHQLFARTVAANLMAESLALPALRMIDQLAELAQLTPPASWQQVDLQPGHIELLMRLPVAECGPPLRARLEALPGFAPASAIELEATRNGCRLRWNASAGVTPDPAAVAARDDSAAAVASADMEANAEGGADLRDCEADSLDAALDRLWQTIERRISADAQRARRTRIQESLAAIEVQVATAPPPRDADQLALDPSAGVLEIEIATLGEDPPAGNRPASFHRRISARTGLPGALTLLESLLGQSRGSSGSGEDHVLPWINRGLSSVQLIRAEDGGEPLLTVNLRQFLPDGYDLSVDASVQCGTDVEPGDGSLAGLSADTRARVDALRQRFPGPLTALPEARLPAARAPRQVAHDPFR